jgi:hypothetical protein
VGKEAEKEQVKLKYCNIEYNLYSCAGHPLPPVILSPNRSLKCKEYNLAWEVTSILTIIEYRLLFRPRQVELFFFN